MRDPQRAPLLLLCKKTVYRHIPFNLDINKNKLINGLMRISFFANSGKPQDKKTLNRQGGLVNHDKDVMEGPFFSASYYCRQWADKTPPVDSEKSAFVHWMKYGRRERIVPTPLFDEEYYKQENPDVEQLDLWGFTHFILHGFGEGRKPNNNLDRCAAEILSNRRNYQLYEALTPGQPLNLKLHCLVGALFLPGYYKQQAGLDELVSDDEAWEHWLREGLRKDTQINPLVDLEYYRRQWGNREPVLKSDTIAFVHWLKYGYAKRIVPTPLFDENFYKAKNKDIALSAIWGFEHYLLHGIKEKRKPCAQVNAPCNTEYAEDFGPLAPYSNFLRFKEFGALRVLTAGQQRVAETLFLSQFYKTQAQLSMDINDEEAWQHWLRIGYAHGTSINPLFDGGYYRQQWGRRCPAITADISPLMHWLRYGYAERIVPTPLFDKDFYLAKYKDISLAGIWGYEHFIIHGIKENRNPNRFFNSGQYFKENKSDLGMMPPYYHYLINKIFGFLREVNPLQHRLAESMFIPRYYKVNAALDKETADYQAWKHWLVEGIYKDIAINPLFDAEEYKRQWGTRMPAIEDEPSSMIHWLKYGVENRIIPTILFDETFYQNTYADIREAGRWGFEHFITNGIKERRWPNSLFDSGRYFEKHKNELEGLPAYYHFLLVGGRLSNSFRADIVDYDPKDIGMPSWVEIYQVAIKKHKNIFEERMRSGVLADVIRRAAEIEPLIHKPNGPRVLSIPPLLAIQSAVYVAAKQIRRATPKASYDNVVCIPHCRVGGAARVAGYLCKCLTEIFKDESLLLVLTDLSEFSRPDWFPDHIDIVDLSKPVKSLPSPQQQTVLLDLLRGVTPKRIFNINSLLCWQTFVTYGLQLKNWSKLYAYFFCYDMTHDDKKVGYPIQYFSTTYNIINKYFIDNSALCDELTERYLLPDKFAKKIKSIWTPIEQSSISTAMLHAEKLLDIDLKQHKWRAFWAGRLDRQKRFDVVVRIAKLMPELEIWAWGHAVLDNGYDITDLPGNIKFMHTFKSFDELPLTKCDFWLYTAQWDGLPTILLEAGIRGLAIVASQVGGTKDVIDDETAWPVKDCVNPAAFVTKIKEMIAAPAVARDRAEKLKKLIDGRHNMQQYKKDVLTALTGESGN